MTELTIDEKLSAERAKRANFVGLSFPVIAGFNANGAMPHYRATPASHAAIEGDGLLLIDSGGQYLGGTTDITRVWPIGTVSAAMKRDVTLVLKGTIALSRTRFPRGTLSPMLDTIARAPLWAEVVASEGTAATHSTYQALTTAGPSITVPLVGDYDVQTSSRIFPGTAGDGIHSYDIGGTGAVDADGHQLALAAGQAGMYAQITRQRRKLAIAAATALVSKYRSIGNVACTFGERSLKVTPVRVG